MPLSLRRGRVSAITERHDELVRLEVDGVACVAYPSVTGGRAGRRGARQRPGPRARAWLGRLRRALREPDARARAPGRGRRACDGAAVHAAPARAPVRRGVGRAQGSLRGLPVVCCSLHSQVAPVCAALGGLRVAYVQLAGGALPVSLSDTVRVLRKLGLVAGTAAVAPCFDGDVQCVSAASALGWTRQAHDVAVCSIGPGIVGTGTRSVTAGSPRRTPPMQRSHSAACR